MKSIARNPNQSGPIRSLSDRFFWLAISLLGGTYIGLILAMILADLGQTSWATFLRAFSQPEIRYAIRLSLISCSVSTIFSLWVAVPLGYLLSRKRFWGRGLIELILDIPLIIPPIVLGLSLLILFQSVWGRTIQQVIPITFAIPSVIIAQFAAGTIFAVQTMRLTFDEINPRFEQIAQTLGCNQAVAFWRIALPQAYRGIFAAGLLTWARAFGEFGPILIFSGTTRLKTEVLPTAIYLELSVGNLEMAIAISILMILVALVVLVLARIWGLKGFMKRAI